MHGPEGIKQYVGMHRGAYPDTRFTVEDHIAEGDEVVTRWTGRGTHQGELTGVLPAGKRVAITGVTINRLSSGKIAETWSYFDKTGMLQQL